MEVKIIYRSLPPNYDKIIAAIPAARRMDAVFCYGQTVHVVGNRRLAPEILVHETVHAHQQINPEEWWDRYLVDKKFRLQQEIEAHRREYSARIDGKGRSERRSALAEISKRLASSFYGGIISKDEARLLIQ